MRRALLLLFVTIFDPITRAGSYSGRGSMMPMIIMIAVIGFAGYYFIGGEDDGEEEDMPPKIEDAINTFEAKSTDEFGRTKLHIAVRYGDIGMVRRLIEDGADVNARDNKGRTPLHMTRYDKKDNTDMMELLLENGADPNIKDNKGNRVLDIVHTYGGSIIKKEKLLREYKAK